MSSSQPEDAALKQAQIEGQNYIDTVQAIVGLAALVVHDGSATRPGASFGFGRRMTRPAYGSEPPQPDVTPDLVAQRSAEYGVVVEAKATLCRDQARWDRHIAQVREYAGSLAGWWTPDETIPTHDAVLLVNISFVVPLIERVEALRAKDPRVVAPRTAIVEFTRQDQIETKLFYRRQWGSISDTELDASLHAGTNVPLSKVLKTFGTVKFYDSAPPLPYLLELLWLEVFPSLAREQDYDHEQRAFPIPVAVEQITGELQRAHGSKLFHCDGRCAEFPTATDVRNALDELIRLGLATRDAKEGAYTIAYRPKTDDVFAWFVKLLSKKSRKPPQGHAAGQLKLFPEDASGPASS